MRISKAGGSGEARIGQFARHMQPVDKEIERPLGQEKRRRDTAGRRAFPVKGVLLGVGAAALVAVSTAISLQPSQFRNPVAVAVSKPKVVAADDRSPEAPASAQSADRTEADSGRPDASVIRVNPESPGAQDSVIVVRDPSSLNDNPRLAHLPDRALIEESEHGPLPVRGPDGTRAFDAYAGKWSGTRGARIAIVIGGLGLSQTGTQRAIDELPPEVTLAFAPQGNSIDRWMRTARREGHEIIIQVPLEPYDFPNVNPGRNTLTVGAPPGENLRELRWALSRTTNYTGIMNYMGARFVVDEQAMRTVMGELGQRGLLYLDDGSSARSLAEDLALDNKVPFALGDMVIDQVRERGAILEKLDELERTARAKGTAVGTASAFDVTVDAVASWAGEVKKRGIELVPVSAVARDPERN